MSSSSPPSTTTYPSPKSTPKPLNRPSSHPHPPPKEIFKSLFNQKTHVPTHYEQMLQKLAHKFASLYEDLKSHKTSKPQSIKKTPPISHRIKEEIHTHKHQYFKYDDEVSSLKKSTVEFSEMTIDEKERFY